MRNTRDNLPTCRTKLLAAWTCLLLQVLGGAHFFLVQHKFCATHGGLVHAADHAEHAVPAPAADGPGVATAAEDDEHTHCPWCLRPREAPPPEPAVVVQALDFLTVRRATAPPTDVPPPAARSGWRVAPKQSPPA